MAEGLETRNGTERVAGAAGVGGEEKLGRLSSAAPGRCGGRSLRRVGVVLLAHPADLFPARRLRGCAADVWSTAQDDRLPYRRPSLWAVQCSVIVRNLGSGRGPFQVSYVVLFWGGPHHHPGQQRADDWVRRDLSSSGYRVIPRFPEVFGLGEWGVARWERLSRYRQQVERFLSPVKALRQPLARAMRASGADSGLQFLEKAEGAAAVALPSFPSAGEWREHLALNGVRLGWSFESPLREVLRPVKPPRPGELKSRPARSCGRLDRLMPPAMGQLKLGAGDDARALLAFGADVGRCVASGVREAQGTRLELIPTSQPLRIQEEGRPPSHFDTLDVYPNVCVLHSSTKGRQERWRGHLRSPSHRSMFGDCYSMPASQPLLPGFKLSLNGSRFFTLSRVRFGLVGR